MLKKIITVGVLATSVLATMPVVAATSTQERLEEAQKKLQDRFTEAQKKIQEKLIALQKNQANRAAAVTCVAAAVNRRETAVAGAFSAFSTSQAAALSARAATLNAAWTSTTTPSVIKKAVDAAWASYRDAHRLAVQTHNSSTRAIWATFKTESKACKTSGTGVASDGRGSGVDSVQ